MHNATLAKILNVVFKIPFGKKTYDIFIPEFIKKSSKEILKKMTGVVLAAESTISIKCRFIALVSKSQRYLEDFQEILLRFNITSQIDKNNAIKITGYRNFEKVRNNFDLIIKDKNQSLDLLVNSLKMKQSPKGLSIVLYLKSLFELKEATSIQIRNNANRKGNSFRRYINELLFLGYVQPVTFLSPVKYKITTSGENYLEDNKTYRI